MSEFDGIFQRLRGQRPPAAFAVPQAIRRRGRRRSQHQALAAGLVVVAVAAGTGWATGLLPVDRSTPTGPTSTATAPSPGPSSVPSPSVAPSPSPTGVPWPSATVPSGPLDLRGRMLLAADLGPGSWRPRPPTEPFEGGDRWHWTSGCPAYVSADYPSLRHQDQIDSTGFAAGAGLDAPYVFEHVHRYATGWGPRALNDVRRAVRVCAQPPDPRRTVVANGFAGDEALLVREEFRPVGAAAFVSLTAVVRVGDLVATVLFSPDRDEQYARTVATAAAQRLAGR